MTTKIKKKPAKKKNTAKMVRNVTIAQDRIACMSYRDIAEKHGISKMTVCRVLKDDEIKEIVTQGQTQAISMIPLANMVYYDRLMDSEEKNLQFQAARDIKKMAGILPSNVMNQTINNIFNQTNNIVTPETMQLVKKLLPGFQDDEVIDIESDN